MPYVRSAIDEKADLRALRDRPGPRVIWGIVIVGISYCIGWPAVGFFGILAVYFEEPLWLVVGGPAIYGISHVVFLVGTYLAGANYVRIIFRWLVRVTFERYADRPASGTETLSSSPPRQASQQSD